MKYTKGAVFESYGENYTVVGKLYIVSNSYVLAPQDEKNIEVLIYTEDEIKEGLEQGWLVIKNKSM